MAARTQRNPSSGRVVHDSPGLQSRASRHRQDLLEEARELMASGRVREARAVEKRAGQVDQLVGALETETGTASTPKAMS